MQSSRTKENHSTSARFISGESTGRRQRPHLHHVRIEFGPWRRRGSAQVIRPPKHVLEGDPRSPGRPAFCAQQPLRLAVPPARCRLKPPAFRQIALPGMRIRLPVIEGHDHGFAIATFPAGACCPRQDVPPPLWRASSESRRAAHRQK